MYFCIMKDIQRKILFILVLLCVNSIAILIICVLKKSWNDYILWSGLATVISFLLLHIFSKFTESRYYLLYLSRLQRKKK